MLKHIFLMAEPGRDSYKREKKLLETVGFGDGEPLMLKSLMALQKKLNVESGRKSGDMCTQRQRHLEGGGSPWSYQKISKPLKKIYYFLRFNHMMAPSKMKLNPKPPKKKKKLLY